MKTKTLISLIALSSLLGGIVTAAPLGTAFTYQGRLNDGANPAQGIYDLRFTVYDALAGGTAVGGPLTNTATSISNGYFTVTLDFGASPFNGSARWLELGVRTNGGAAFATLSPRQPLTPAPYALYATSAGTAAMATTAGSASSVAAADVTGTLALGQLPAAVVTNNASGITLAGSFSGNGAGVTNLSLATVNSFGAIGWTTNWAGFTAGPSPTAGSQPSCATAADVNQDGLLDLISANSQANTLSVLTNNGRGGFVLASSPGVGGMGPEWVVAADLNGDGKPDLVSANSGNDTVSVLTNNGQGSFVLAFSAPVGRQPDRVTAADVNQDGRLDLITANVGANALSVFINNGGGSFVSSGNWTVGSMPFSVAAADVNGDGWVDLVSANGGNDTLTVLTNTRSGGFYLAASPAVGQVPSSVVAADLNGDGKVDLVSANSSANTLSVLINNGSGGFVLTSSPGVGQSPRGLTAADVNGDGKVDLICANDGVNTLTVLTNNGSGGFGFHGSLPVGTSPQCASAADVNGDGWLDLISANRGNNTLTVLFGTISLTASFTGQGGALTGLNASQMTSGTLSAARLPAVAVTNTQTGLTLSGTFSGNAAGLTNLNASQLASGTVADARLSANVALLGANQAFTGSNRFAGVVVLTNAANAIAGTFSGTSSGTFSGNGAGLTNLNASQMTSGTLPAARLPAVAVTNTQTGLTLGGTFSGNGASLTNLNASQLASGTVADGRLSANVALLNTNQAFTGSNRFAGVITLTNVANTLAGTFNGTSSGTFTGNGSGLTNLSASQLTSGTLPLSQLPAVAVTNNQNGITLSGTFSGNGGGMTNLNAATLTGTMADARLSANVALRNAPNTFTATNVFTTKVGIGIATPGQPLQIGNPGLLGSQGIVRLAARSSTDSNNRIWDIGVPQTGSDVSGYGYSFVIDDTQLGSSPELVVHWGNGFVGIGRTNPATALDVNGTVTASNFVGNAVCSANYVFSYSTITQAVGVVGTFQDITNNTDAQISGWTHAANTASFTCAQSGLYRVDYNAEATTTTTASSSVSVRAVVNGTEIPGSQATANANTANLVVPISRSFIASVSSGGVLKFQLTGSSVNDRLVSNTGTGTTRPSFSCTIMRLQ